MAVVNVAVIPMTSDTILRDMTVLIRDGRIASIGPSRSATVPQGARQIDGRGKYLLPGLADAHAHLFSDEYIPDSLASYELGFLLANGVTAARLMIGTPEQLTLREGVRRGEMAGPQMWIASPQLTGNRVPMAMTVTTPDAARDAVRQAGTAGYDFIKLTDNLPPPIWEAIMDEARLRNIPVDGHVDLRVGIERALAAKQHIQHVDGYLEFVLADSAPSRAGLTQGGVGQLQRWKTMDHVDARKIAQAGGMTARAGIFSTPTLTVFNKAFGIGFTDEELRNRPDWEMMPARYRDLYMRARERYWNPANDSVRTPERMRRYVDTRGAIAKAIVDSGGKLLAGSDAPDLLMAYGYTLHRELESMVKAGISPYQALLSATRNAAEFYGALDEWGTIQRGRRADFILLTANPLENISNTARIDAVSIGGRLIEKAEIDRLIRIAKEKING